MKWYFTVFLLLSVQLSFGQESTNIQVSKEWSLYDCITYAIEHNISVKDASLDKNMAEIDYDKTKSLKLPNLFGNASQSFSNGNSVDPITSDYVSDQIHSSNVSLNSSIVLFQGNQINNQIEQSELLLQQSAFIEEEAKNNIILSVLKVYLQLLYNKEDIEISENNLVASENQLKLAKARLDAGEIALSDYTEIQSQVSTNQYSVIAAKSNYQQKLIELKQLLELPLTQDMDIESIDENLDLLNLDIDKNELYAKALDYLPEYKASKLNIDISKKDLAIAKGAYLPTVSLAGSIGTGYTSINNNRFSTQFNKNFNQQIGFTLSIPIFNRNQTKAAVNKAAINISKAEIQVKNVEKEILANVETAYQNALSTQEQVLAAQASLEAAEQSYQLAQKKFELGELSSTDLIINQNTYMNAQQKYLQTKYLNILYYQLLQFYQGNEINL